MGPVQTLHEFALNLLSDPQALADFDTDPQGVLNAAGLGDLSAADVHEILPLVMDTAPASLAEAPGSFAEAGDVAGTLDGARADMGDAAAPAADGADHLAAETLSGLPNLSGVFGAVSDAATATGLNTVTDSVLHTASGTLDSVADATAGVPVAGPLVSAGAIDLQHTVAGVGEHLYDGQLVGAAVDGVTNHLGDSLLASTTVDTVSDLPVVGGPAGGLVEEVRQEGGAVLGTVNEAIGSTPIGDPSGRSADDFSAANDTFDTVDHAASAVPAAAPVPELPAMPATPELPAAVPETPGVEDAAGAVQDTVGDLPADVPADVPSADAVVDQVSGTVSDAGVSDIQHGVPDVPGADHVGSVVGGVQDQAHSVGGDLAGGMNLPATDNLPSADDLHLGM